MAAHQFAEVDKTLQQNVAGGKRHLSDSAQLDKQLKTTGDKLNAEHKRIAQEAEKDFQEALAKLDAQWAQTHQEFDEHQKVEIANYKDKQAAEHAKFMDETQKKEPSHPRWSSRVLELLKIVKGLENQKRFDEAGVEIKRVQEIQKNEKAVFDANREARISKLEAEHLRKQAKALAGFEEKLRVDREKSVVAKEAAERQKFHDNKEFTMQKLKAAHTVAMTNHGKKAVSAAHSRHGIPAKSQL